MFLLDITFLLNLMVYLISQTVLAVSAAETVKERFGVCPDCPSVPLDVFFFLPHCVYCGVGLYFKRLIVGSISREHGQRTFQPFARRPI